MNAAPDPATSPVAWVHPRRCMLRFPLQAGEVRRMGAPSCPRQAWIYDLGCPACGARNTWIARKPSVRAIVEGAVVEGELVEERPLVEDEEDRTEDRLLEVWSHPASITTTRVEPCNGCSRGLTIVDGVLVAVGATLGGMTPEHHALLAGLSPAHRAALFTAAVGRRVAVNHVVDHLLGRTVYAVHPEGALKGAAEAVPAEVVAEIVKLGPTWPAAPPPEWIVVVLGGQSHDLDATTAIMKKHFPPGELPVRVELRPGRAWVIARLHGTQESARDVVRPEVAAELLGGITLPQVAPELYELRPEHEADLFMVELARRGLTKDEVIDELHRRGVDLANRLVEAKRGETPAPVEVETPAAEG